MSKIVLKNKLLLSWFSDGVAINEYSCCCEACDIGDDNELCLLLNNNWFIDNKGDWVKKLLISFKFICFANLKKLIILIKGKQDNIGIVIVISCNVCLNNW